MARSTFYHSYSMATHNYVLLFSAIGTAYEQAIYSAFWGGLAQFVAYRTVGRAVPGSILVRGVVCCDLDLEQVTFPQLSMYICVICSYLVTIQSSTELMLIVNIFMQLKIKIIIIITCILNYSDYFLSGSFVKRDNVAMTIALPGYFNSICTDHFKLIIMQNTWQELGQPSLLFPWAAVTLSGQQPYRELSHRTRSSSPNAGNRCLNVVRFWHFVTLSKRICHIYIYVKQSYGI